jgi:hypothetical protein
MRCLPCDHPDIGRARDGIEYDLGAAVTQLSLYRPTFGIEAMLMMAVVGAFAQHEGFNYTTKRIGGQRVRRNYDHGRGQSVNQCTGP